jgi:hypothetical protein
MLTIMDMLTVMDMDMGNKKKINVMRPNNYWDVEV